MTGLLSIIWRELTVGARQRSTHRGRLIAGAIVVGFFALFLGVQNAPPNVLGTMIFSIAAMLLFLQALTAGLRYTADCLSEEKRDGTLGLLFLTELKSFEIVLGKMVARSLRGFYGMIATLPILTFCILLGGIRGMDTLNMAILLVATMLYSLAAGMFISSVTTEDKTAFLGTIAFLTGLCVLPPVIWKIFAATTKSSALDFILYLSPFYAMHARPAFVNAEFMRSVVCMAVVSAVFLALAARNLAMSFKRDFAKPMKVVPEWRIDQSVWPRNSRRQLEINPFRWLLEREHLYRKILAVIALVGIVGPFIAVKWFNRGIPGTYPTIVINSFYALHFLWKLLVASDALRRLHHDRRSGALEQLLVTPLTVEQILSAQLKRTFRMFLPSAIAIAIGNLIFASDWIFGTLRIIAYGGALFLFIDARALIWQATLQALKPARYPIAILRVVGVTLLPPILILMLMTWTVGLVGPVNFAWFAGCAIYDAVLIQMAKSKLKSHFRELASQTVKASKPRRPLPKPLQWLLLMDPVTTSAR